MTSLRTLDNTILGNTPIPTPSKTSTGKATAKSVLEKLKSLSLNAATTAKGASDDALEELHMSGTPGESSSSPLLMLRYVFAFLLVAFLLLNILGSLGLLPNVLEDFFKPVLVFFGHSVGQTVKQTAEVGAKGVEAAIDLPVHAMGGAIDALHEKVNPDQEAQAKALNKPEQDPNQDESPQPDEATSRTQVYRGSGKSGYCYIGEDRGFRSCIEVQNDDECMSGKIFPTRDICINPTLRQ